MEWLKRSFRPSLMAPDGKVPTEQSLVLADNLHAQTKAEYDDLSLQGVQHASLALSSQHD